jgi:hypothetical protein
MLIIVAIPALTIVGNPALVLLLIIVGNPALVLLLHSSGVKWL